MLLRIIFVFRTIAIVALTTTGVKLLLLETSGYLSEHLVQRSLCANECTGESKGWDHCDMWLAGGLTAATARISISEMKDCTVTGACCFHLQGRRMR
jgi:hypothetical protein